MKKLIVFLIILTLVVAIGYVSFRGYEFMKWQGDQVEVLKLENIELKNKLKIESGKADYWSDRYIDEASRPPEKEYVKEYVPYQVPNQSFRCNTYDYGYGYSSTNCY